MLHIIDIYLSWVITIISIITFNDSFYISILLDTNYADQKEKILLTLGCMDLDLTLYVNEPSIPMESSSLNETGPYEQ